MVAATTHAGAETAEFSRCLEAAAGDAAVNQCYYAEPARPEARVQAALGTLLAGQYTQVDRQRLQAAQAAWIAYRNSHCTWAWALPWDDLPEALIPLTCTMHQNERRADELTQQHVFFGSGDGSGVEAPAPATSGSFVVPDSSQRLLTRADLAGLSMVQLRIAWYEIYARIWRLTGPFSAISHPRRQRARTSPPAFQHDALPRR